MSGGSYNYVYRQIKDAADKLECNSELRLALKEMLYYVADAMHDVEWVDSGDMSPGDEEDAISVLFSRCAHFYEETDRPLKSIAKEFAKREIILEELSRTIMPSDFDKKLEHLTACKMALYQYEKAKRIFEELE